MKETLTVRSPAEAARVEGYEDALTDFLFQLADDDLVIGHRASEWLGLAPHIEEDVAFSSIAQDEVGHAATYYGLLQELGRGRADDLAYGRPPDALRNAVLLERPNGPGHYMNRPHYDWGFTIARHYLYDLFEAVRLEALTRSSYTPLAEAAAKIRREERYHLLHQETWLRRLAQHGGEARERVEAGLCRAWADVGGLFTLGRFRDALLAHDIVPVSPEGMQERWQGLARQILTGLGLAWPGDPGAPEIDGRLGQHTPDLASLLDVMTEVYRLDPAAAW